LLLTASRVRYSGVRLHDNIGPRESPFRSRRGALYIVSSEGPAKIWPRPMAAPPVSSGPSHSRQCVLGGALSRIQTEPRLEQHVRLGTCWSQCPSRFWVTGPIT